MNNDKGSLKWPEVFSLAGLNAAVVISWIAYHEYQPVLLKRFEFNELADFLLLAKAIILVVIPPFAGWLADLILKKNGRFFTIFAIGIGSTAMVFMIVASLIGTSDLSGLHDFLPVMMVLWLIAMNLFISPANSMIEAFAPVQKLPIVMGVLFLTTEVLYALEPVIIDLIHFFGDTVTFIVGGVLIAGTGIIFQRVSKDEVVSRRKEMSGDGGNRGSVAAIFTIIIVALGLGIGKALIVEFLPGFLNDNFPDRTSGEIFTFGLLGFSAILGFAVSGLVTRFKLNNVIVVGFVILVVGSSIMLFGIGFNWVVVGAFLTAIAFSLINISGLPFAIKNLSPRNITYGVGIYIGAGEIFTGILENI